MAVTCRWGRQRIGHLAALRFDHIEEVLWRPGVVVAVRTWIDIFKVIVPHLDLRARDRSTPLGIAPLGQKAEELLKPLPPRLWPSQAA